MFLLQSEVKGYLFIIFSAFATKGSTIKLTDILNLKEINLVILSSLKIVLKL